eukprot:3538621-Pyramimonas_sp.AAC.1
MAAQCVLADILCFRYSHSRPASPPRVDINYCWHIKHIVYLYYIGVTGPGAGECRVQRGGAIVVCRYAYYLANKRGGAGHDVRSRNFYSSPLHLVIV